MIVDSVASCCQQKYTLLLLLMKFFRTLDDKKSLGSIKTFHFTRVLSSWRHSLFERLSLSCEAIYEHLFKMIHSDRGTISRKVSKIITFLVGWRRNFTHLCWHLLYFAPKMFHLKIYFAFLSINIYCISNIWSLWPVSGNVGHDITAQEYFTNNILKELMKWSLSFWVQLTSTTMQFSIWSFLC